MVTRISRTCLLLLITLIAVMPVARAQQSQQPPIIDREIFFGDPEIAGAQLSPDGKYLSFVKPFKGTRNVWVKGINDLFDKAKPVTADTKRPIPSYFWTRDSRFILFVQDQAGDENYNVFAVNPADSMSVLMRSASARGRAGTSSQKSMAISASR